MRRAIRFARTCRSTEILAAARTAGADAVYPGYGFLSENPDLAEGCARAGITFVGPPADMLELAGNKARAIAAARAAGLPVLASSEPSADPAVLVAAASGMEFPVFVKAVAGGGGRGMRRVGSSRGAAGPRWGPRCGKRRPRSVTPPCSWSRR